MYGRAVSSKVLDAPATSTRFSTLGGMIRSIHAIFTGLLISVSVASAGQILNQTGFVASSVDLPPGARGIIRLAPGGGMGTFDQGTWTASSMSLGSLGDGSLTITVQDLGPATCAGDTCTPVGANYQGGAYLQGDIFEVLLNQDSLGFTQDLDENDKPQTPIAYVNALNSKTFNVPITAGDYSLNFDNVTIGYLDNVWPAASIAQNGDNENIVPADFTTDAFQVTVTFTAPEPASWLLLAGGMAVCLGIRRLHTIKISPDLRSQV
jgi:hypothetical protein